LIFFHIKGEIQGASVRVVVFIDLYGLLTQALGVSVRGCVPLSIGAALPSLVTDQNEVLVALERHLGAGHKEEVALAPETRGFQYAARDDCRQQNQWLIKGMRKRQAGKIQGFHRV
jgi:hypothetical protein